MKLAPKLIVMVVLAYTLFCYFILTPSSAQRKNNHRNNSSDSVKPHATSESKTGKPTKPRLIVVASAAPNASWTTDITNAELETTMVQLGRFNVLSRSALEAIIKEHKLAQSDIADPNQAVQIGKLLTARYAIIGKCISAELKEGAIPFIKSKKQKLNVIMQMQLVDVQTGQILDSYQYQDKAEVTSVDNIKEKKLGLEDYRKLVKEFSNQFANRISLSLPIEAFVVLVKNNEIAIDAGADASVKPGLEFEVYTEGEAIRNGAGQILAYDRNIQAKIRITRIEPKLAWAEVLQTFGSSGQPDPSPNFTRIKRDYAVKQIGTTQTDNNNEPTKKKK